MHGACRRYPGRVEDSPLEGEGSTGGLCFLVTFASQEADCCDDAVGVTALLASRPTSVCSLLTSWFLQQSKVHPASAWQEAFRHINGTIQYRDVE